MRTTQPKQSDELLDATPVEDEVGSFGTWLRCQREGREIDLREIAEASKISLTYLQAFEEDRFDILPASVFAKGFLRQYARYVGLDPEEVINFYLSARQELEGEEEAFEPNREAERSSNWRFAVLALVITAVVVVLIWLLSRWNEQEQAGPRSAPVARPAVVAVPPATVTEAMLPGTGPEAPPVEPEPSAPVAPGAPLRVALDFSSECWVEAYVDGVRETSRMMIQGESLLLEAAEMVEFTVGDAHVVEVEVNGRPFALGGQPGQVRTQRIDLATAAALAGTVPGSGAEP